MHSYKEECYVFEGAVIAIRSVIQEVVALSSAGVELIALVMCIQEMIGVASGAPDAGRVR